MCQPTEVCHGPDVVGNEWRNKRLDDGTSLMRCIKGAPNEIVPDTSPQAGSVMKVGEYTIVFGVYFRYGALTSENVNIGQVQWLAKAIDGIINAFGLDVILNSLMQNTQYFRTRGNPTRIIGQKNDLWLVGSNGRNFVDLKVFDQAKTVDGNRSMLDVAGFPPFGDMPGMLNPNIFNCPYGNEDVIFHELCHAIHTQTFQGNVYGAQISSYYVKYKVPNSIYQIDSYSFMDEREFFAEFMQVFCGLTKRMDKNATGGVDLRVLTNNLTDLHSFFTTICKDPKMVRFYACQTSGCEEMCSVSMPVGSDLISLKS